MRKIHIVLLLASVLLVFLTVACRPQNPEVAPTPTLAAIATVPAEVAPTDEPSNEPPTPETTLTETAVEATTESTAESTAAPEADSELPPSVVYNLGEATIIQDWFPEDSRFRNMPVRLEGVMAAPQEGEGPFPVVVILHGTHPGCPVDEMDVDRWPCDPEVEQKNYMGFEYLARELAARGYVALAPNINAENTFGFGEPLPGVRLRQLLDLQLRALAAAAAGGENGFGVELSGVADVSRLALVGHSRGGEMANYLTRAFDLDDPQTAAALGYGPVVGLLLVAPPRILMDSVGSDEPLAVILPACDGDVVQQDGQHFYEAVRFQAEHTWATTTLLEGANHNAFNSILGGDMVAHTGRPGCQTLLAPEEQRQFLVDYAADFLTAVLGQADEASPALTRLGVDPSQEATDELFGRPARVAGLVPSADRLRLFGPVDEASLTANALGGVTTADGATLFFCPEGYTVDAELAPCRRPNFVNPANPVMAVVGWSGPAELRFELPAGARDLSGYTTLSLRAVIDPLSELNAADTPQSFSVRLTDGGGDSATVIVEPDEPALQFPSGEFTEDETFPPGLLDAIVHMTDVRLDLSAFAGVDLSDVAEVALVFDQTESGTLFLADVEVVRPPEP